MNNPLSSPVEIDADVEEAVRLVASGSKDKAAVRSAQAHADDVRRELQAKYGVRNLAVDLIADARDGR